MPETRRTISPLTFFLEKCSSSWGGVPRRNSSNCLVSSRATQRGRSGSSAARVSRERRRRCGDSRKTEGSSAARAVWSSRSRCPLLTGRKPRYRKGPSTSPEPATAVMTLEAPGRTVCGICSWIAALRSRIPGSEMPGIPASVMTAIEVPLRSCWMSSAVRMASLCWW